MKTRRVFAFALALLLALSLAVQTASAADALMLLYLEPDAEETAKDVIRFFDDILSKQIGVTTEGEGDAVKRVVDVVQGINDNGHFDYTKLIEDYINEAGNDSELYHAVKEIVEKGQDTLDITANLLRNVQIVQLIVNEVPGIDLSSFKLEGEDISFSSGGANFLLVEDGIPIVAASALKTKTTEGGTFLQGGVFAAAGENLHTTTIRTASLLPDGSYSGGKTVTRSQFLSFLYAQSRGTLLSYKADENGQYQTIVTRVSIEGQVEDVGDMGWIFTVKVEEPDRQTHASPPNEYVLQTENGTLLYGLNSTIAQDFGGYGQLGNASLGTFIVDLNNQQVGDDCVFCGVEISDTNLQEHTVRRCNAHCASQTLDENDVKLVHLFCLGCKQFMCVNRTVHLLTCKQHYLCAGDARVKDNSDHYTKCPSGKHYLCVGCPCTTTPAGTCSECKHAAHATRCTVKNAKGVPCGCNMNTP